MKKRICFVVNPIAGVGRQRAIAKLIDQQLDHALFSCEVVHTRAARHATELARDAASRHTDIVVAVGGDGSANEIARGLLNTKTAMALLPTGSGNGLARHLNIPLDLKKAMAVINRAKVTLIDSMQMNDEPFINIAGVGFDAHIAWEFARFGNRGFSAYLNVIARELLKYKARDFELVIDGKTIRRNAYLISFANGSQWGSNAWIAPTADIADGAMDIALLPGFNLLGGLAIGCRLFRKTLHQSPYLEIIRAREAIVRQQGSIAHLDGEPVEMGHEIRIKVNPLSLQVVTPYFQEAQAHDPP